jgi:hypothetical protein
MYYGKAGNEKLKNVNSIKRSPLILSLNEEI